MYYIKDTGGGTIDPPKSNKSTLFVNEYTPKSSQTLQLEKSPHEKKSEIAITDSGATDDLTSHKSLFEYLIPLQIPKWVTLGDDKTQLKIVAYGMLNYKIKYHRIRRMGYYVPNLGTTLISI